jgi:hypothetical protein
MARLLSVAAILLATLAGSVEASQLSFPRRVLFVGNQDTRRTAAFVELLEKHFAEVRVADRKSFKPAAAADVDVVLLDWSQQDTAPARDVSPLGDREEWSKPTVLLGSAGHLLAGPWQVIGGSG